MSDGDLHRLPDQLRADLRLVFVGTAASTRSAAVGHYYAHPSNRFWRALHEAGITPRRYQPDEFAALLELGIEYHAIGRQHALRNAPAKVGANGLPKTANVADPVEAGQ